MARPAPGIAQLKHRVVLATMKDVVDQGGTMELSRKEVVRCWAAVENYRAHGDFIGMAGYVVLDPLQHRSHTITIRKQLNIDITAAAWIYEERRISPPIWYKVLGFAERGNFIEISAHLHERSELAQQPTGDLTPIANKVAL